MTGGRSYRRRRSRGGIVTVEIGPRHTSWLWGPRVYEAVTETGVPFMRCPLRHTLCVPTSQLDDVLAYLEDRSGCVVQTVTAS